jgi:hypothetical protein
MGIGYDRNRIIRMETGIPFPVNRNRNDFKEFWFRLIRTGNDV